MKSIKPILTFAIVALCCFYHFSCTKDDNSARAVENLTTENRNSTPTVDYVNEICEGEESNFIFNFSGTRNVFIDLNTDGVWVNIHTAIAVTTGYSWSKQFGEGSYTLRFRTTGGFSPPFTSVGELNVKLCCNLQGNSFYGLTFENYCDTLKAATYIFSSEKGEHYFKIQGGLTNFVLGEPTVFCNPSNLICKIVKPGKSSNRIITVEGALETCTFATINIFWKSSNQGSNITGNWTVKDSNGNDLAPEIAPLLCNY